MAQSALGLGLKVQSRGLKRFRPIMLVCMYSFVSVSMLSCSTECFGAGAGAGAGNVVPFC